MQSLLLSFFMILSFSDAYAYIPPSEFIIKKLAEQRSGLKTVVLESNVMAYEGDRAAGVFFKDITRVDFSRGTLESVAVDAEGKPIFLRKNRLSQLGSPAGQLLFGNEMGAVTQVLLLAHLPVRTEKMLEQFSDETKRRGFEITAFQKFNDIMTWVIGTAQSNSKGIADQKITTGDKGAQLWIEKHSFRPIRWIDFENRETRFLNFHNFQGLTYPKETRFFRQEKQYMVVEHIPNQTSATVFATQVDSTGYTVLGNEQSSDIKELLTDFYQQIR